MATTLYMTGRTPPQGTKSIPTFTVGTQFSGFEGDYAYPTQGTVGVCLGATHSVAAMVTNQAWAGPRGSFNSGKNTEIQFIAPGTSGIGTYYWHANWNPIATFGIVLAGTQTLLGSGFMSGGCCQVLNMIGVWHGKVSYYDDTRGPGKCGIFPRRIFVMRPSTGGAVGDLAVADDAGHLWTETFNWATTAADAYENACSSFPSIGAGYSTVADVDTLDGDVLCVEWWGGRVMANGSWTFNAWDKQQYPDSVDGETLFSTTYIMPVGGSSEPALYSSQIGGGSYTNTLRSTQTINFREFAPRSPQTSISVSP